MKEWITEVLIPYRKKVIDEDPDLNDDQKAILYINVYPVHTGEPFRGYVTVLNASFLSLYLLTVLESINLQMLAFSGLSNTFSKENFSSGW